MLWQMTTIAIMFFTAVCAETEVSWGPSIRGLQVGLVPLDATTYIAGDIAKFEVHIRNVEDEPIEFRFVDYTLTQWFPRFWPADGQLPTPVWLPDNHGGRFYEERLEAGESKPLGVGWLQLRPLGALEPVKETTAFVVPGVYRMSGVIHVHRSFEETVALSTGAVRFVVEGAPPEVASSRDTTFSETAMADALRLLGEGFAIRQSFWRSQPITTSAAMSLDVRPWQEGFGRLDVEAIAYVRHIADYHPEASYADVAAKLLD